MRACGLGAQRRWPAFDRKSFLRGLKCPQHERRTSHTNHDMSSPQASAASLGGHHAHAHEAGACCRAAPGSCSCAGDRTRDERRGTLAAPLSLCPLPPHPSAAAQDAHKPPALPHAPHGEHGLAAAYKPIGSPAPIIGVAHLPHSGKHNNGSAAPIFHTSQEAEAAHAHGVAAAYVPDGAPAAMASLSHIANAKPAA